MDTQGIDQRLAARLRALRAERGWSLDELAGLSGVSRATLSRLEKAEVSPTAQVLGRLGAAYGLTMSRLMHLVEGGFAPVIRDADQEAWTDPETGFTRRTLSPPAQALAGETVRGDLPAGQAIAYSSPPRPGLEHHLVMLEGRLTVTVDGQAHDLYPGDCLRYQLYGSSRFETPADSAARYIIFIV